MNKKPVYTLKKTELIGLEALQDLIELGLWSAYVKGERIVSLLIVAEPESGKTELMKKYRKNKGVFVRRRFTSYGIIRDLLDGKMELICKSPKILGHLIVYDYATIFAFKSNTVDTTIEFLDALTEEGLSCETEYWIKEADLKKFAGLKAGLIAGINTFGFFTSGRKVKTNLYKGGWFSRNIVVSFAISETMKSKIFDSITQGKYRYDKDYVGQIRLLLPLKRTNVKISREYAQKFET